MRVLRKRRCLLGFSSDAFAATAHKGGHAQHQPGAQAGPPEARAAEQQFGIHGEHRALWKKPTAAGGDPARVPQAASAGPSAISATLPTAVLASGLQEGATDCPRRFRGNGASTAPRPPEDPRSGIGSTFLASDLPQSTRESQLLRSAEKSRPMTRLEVS